MKFKSNPPADKKCHKSCVSKTLTTQDLFRFLENAGLSFVDLTGLLKYMSAGIQHIIAVGIIDFMPMYVFLNYEFNLSLNTEIHPKIVKFLL